MNIKDKTIYHADNLDILRAIDTETVDLIYLDPPFNKRSTFTAKDKGKINKIKQFFIEKQKTGDLPDFMLKDNIEEIFKDVKFGDEWRESDIKPIWRHQIEEKQPLIRHFLESIKQTAPSGGYFYLTFMAIRLIEMKRIIKDTGSIYLHCDPHMSHYLKIIMDVIFGEQNFRNEINWHYGKWSNVAKCFQKNHDIILFYSKNNEYIFNIQFQPFSSKTAIAPYARKIDARGIAVQDKTKPMDIKKKEKKGVAMHDTWDIPIVHPMAKERTGYPTQKPLALLERIITASSNTGDVVLDPFCGCATTCIAAERLNRQWIGIDISPQAAYMVYYRAYHENLTTDNIGEFKWNTEYFNLQKEPPTPTNPKHKQQYELTKQTEEEYLQTKKINQMELIKLNKIQHRQLTQKEKEEMKEILYKEQAGLCNGCDQYKRPVEMEIDHIQPRAHDGAHTIENRQLLCHLCNNLKRTKTMQYLIHKLNNENLIPKEVFNKQIKKYTK